MKFWILNGVICLVHLVTFSDANKHSVGYNYSFGMPLDCVCIAEFGFCLFNKLSDSRINIKVLLQRRALFMHNERNRFCHRLQMSFTSMISIILNSTYTYTAILGIYQHIKLIYVLVYVSIFELFAILSVAKLQNSTETIIRRRGVMCYALKIEFSIIKSKFHLHEFRLLIRSL